MRLFGHSQHQSLLSYSRGCSPMDYSYKAMALYGKRQELISTLQKTLEIVALRLDDPKLVGRLFRFTGV